MRRGILYIIEIIIGSVVRSLTVVLRLDARQRVESINHGRKCAENDFMTFQEMNLSEPVMQALQEKNYQEPTPIQQQAIPEGLLGRDILGIAQTGTGKTAAFAIPIIELLMVEPRSKKEKRQIRALILSPTRELAIQTSEAFADYEKYSNLKHTVIYGGVNQNPQTERLRHGVDILIATPGRLLDLIRQKFINLDHVTHFVLDEADRMLDMGFIHDIRTLLPMLPKQKQTMLFSATMPDAIDEISKALLRNPERIEATPTASVVDTIEQHIYFVERPQKTDLLINLLKEREAKSVLIFARTKHGADRIAKILCKKHIDCEAIHGNKSQNARQRALNNFKSGKTRIIVATDIAARGLDICNLELVINYDMPDVAETYVHRIGRTGRAGNTGVALSFCSMDEHTMVRDIQHLIGQRLDSVMISA